MERSRSLLESSLILKLALCPPDARQLELPALVVHPVISGTSFRKSSSMEITVLLTSSGDVPTASSRVALIPPASLLGINSVPM